jgi:hypothetical protein
MAALTCPCPNPVRAGDCPERVKGLVGVEELARDLLPVVSLRDLACSLDFGARTT